MQFDKDAFAELLNKARGDMSQRAYAKKCGVDFSLISRYINRERDNPPSGETIQKLAQGAPDVVTYEELLLAAGYLRDPSASPGDQNPTFPIYYCNMSFLDKEVREWAENPKHAEFLRFIYRASNKGVTIEALDNAQIIIDVNEG